MYAILLLLFMAEPRPVTIIHNQNLHSKMIVGDLKRDWTEKISNETTVRLSEIQTKLKPRIRFVDITSLDSKVLKYSHLGVYPAIQYGERGDAEYLPENAYMMSSFPLLSLEAFINQIEFNYNDYQELCVEAERKTANKYEDWLLKNTPEAFGLFQQKVYGNEGWYEGYNLFDIRKEFIHTKDFPNYIIDYPERPRIWYPWEKHYLFEKSKDRIFPYQLEAENVVK